MENYEKKYKEALEWARKVMQGKVGFVLDEVLEKFPELKESENERIKKEITELVMQPTWKTEKEFHRRKELCAWLEKQAQKPVDKKGMNLVEEEMTPFQKKVFCIIDTTIEEEQGLKQVCDELLRLAHNETAWGEEDETYLDHIITAVKLYYTDDKGKENPWRNELLRWLKSLKERVQPQTKYAWSEEDERIYQSIMDDTVQENQLDDKQTNWLRDIKYRYFPQPEQEWSEWDKTIIESIEALCDEKIESVVFQDVKEHVNNIKDWLKSFKERYTWKPSEEQIKAVRLARSFVTDDFDENPTLSDVLVELEKQLKKLREE